MSRQSKALTIILVILLVLIFFTIGGIIYEYYNFQNCVNREHPACPVFACSAIDNVTAGKNSNWCGPAAWRIDDTDGYKYCSGYPTP